MNIVIFVKFGKKKYKSRNEQIIIQEFVQNRLGIAKKIFRLAGSLMRVMQIVAKVKMPNH
ncbi:MAG: hypothetical protein CM1200mP10_17560 [Candidatus Neomarinimicrobiota bacterium]|nr:MAG: hypothetical protein CM1200mP10_17560 [Candidatus Neomarinimicrobiota bacterium]